MSKKSDKKNQSLSEAMSELRVELAGVPLGYFSAEELPLLLDLYRGRCDFAAIHQLRAISRRITKKQQEIRNLLG